MFTCHVFISANFQLKYAVSMNIYSDEYIQCIRCITVVQGPIVSVLTQTTDIKSQWCWNLYKAVVRWCDYNALLAAVLTIVELTVVIAAKQDSAFVSLWILLHPF